MGREKKDDGRGRNWATIFYAENHTQADVVSLLSSAHLKYFVSPIHDKDIWTKADISKKKEKLHNDLDEGKITEEEYNSKKAELPIEGDPKKAHFHALVMFDGNKSPKQMKQLFESLDGVGFERVSDLRSYSRYLCHLDEGGLKPLYNVEEVRQGGGADFRSTARSEIERVTSLQDILLFIRHNELTSYDDLIDLCIDSGLTDYLDLITKTYHHVITAYMAAKSRKFWAREQARKDLDFKERQDQHEELMLQILDSMRRRR